MLIKLSTWSCLEIRMQDEFTVWGVIIVPSTGWRHCCWHCLSLLEDSWKVIKEFFLQNFTECRLSFCRLFSSSCPWMAVQFLNAWSGGCIVLVLSSFSLPLCQCWNCRGRRGGGSLLVCVRGVSIPWCIALASLKTSARFSSKLTLSVTPLKQWVHSFCQSSGVWRYSAAYSDANSLFSLQCRLR